MGDDVLLGAGGTDAHGNFESSPGIGLSRPLVENELIYAVDTSVSPPLVGPSATVAMRALAPAMSPLMTLMLVGILGAFGFWRLAGASKAK